MKNEYTYGNFQTADMACAAALLLFLPLEAIDRTDRRRAYFLFKHSDALERILEEYRKSALKVEPRAYFDSIKALKTRLYERI